MDDDIFTVSNVPRVSVQAHVSNEYNIRLARVISQPDDFAEEFQCLRTAGENDIVHMDILSPGGSIDTCIMLRRAMAACNANIVGWVGPTCASAASAIALQCDGWEVDDMSAFMIHTGSFGVGWGKARDVEASASHTRQQVENFIRLVYTGFLTEDEILRVLDGKELYFVGEELAERLEAYAEYRDAGDSRTAKVSQKELDEIEAQE